MGRWLRVLSSTAAALFFSAAAPTGPAAAESASPRIGIVVMHGKGGSPGGYVAPLAGALKDQGYLVANLEMPWSGRRSYDADVAAAEAEVSAALEALRAQGAARLFVAGHSQGGLFALYFGGRHPLDGIIAIAPGGSASSPAYREKLGDSLSRARELVASGRAKERAEFLDFEGSKGTYRIRCAAASYLSWLDPEGAMNEPRAVRNMDPSVPVLFIVPSGDYQPLRGVGRAMFAALPRHPQSRLYEPDASHLGAPAASIEEIARWTHEVATGGGAGSHPDTR